MKKLMTVICLALMMTSCGTTATTPYLREPEKRKYPKFSQQELASMKECIKSDFPCIVEPSIIKRLAKKDVMCRTYAAEAIAVIRANNEKAAELRK